MQASSHSLTPNSLGKPGHSRASVPIRVSCQLKRSRQAVDTSLGRRQHLTCPPSTAGRSRCATVSALSDESILFLDNGEAILFPRKRKDQGPRFDFSKEEALKVQLEALHMNDWNGDEKQHDYSVEVMYRFADFDPFERSKYFGRNLDLGQFERFRRVWHAAPYATLMNHEHCTWLSSLTVSSGAGGQGGQ
eukprot:gene25984-11671_t